MPPQPKRILIAAGGTGGHLFPAQALAEELLKEQNPPEILFAAKGLSTNRYFDSKRYAFKEVEAGPIFSLKGFLKNFKGVGQSLKLLHSFSPDLVIGFGSFFAAPLLVAARLKGIPFILHESNAIPGKANRFFARFAECMIVHFPSENFKLYCEVIQTPMPLRAGFSSQVITKQEARQYYQLDPDCFTLLVFGGSQGAKALNERVLEGLNRQKALQVIHFLGANQDPDQAVAVYASKGIRCCVKAFETNMSMAWKAADAFIGRAGAATIAEAIECEVPGLLVPYPFATDQHQDKNADVLVSIGAGKKIVESQLTNNNLNSAIDDFIANASSFQQSMRRYKASLPKQTFTKAVMEYLQGSQPMHYHFIGVGGIGMSGLARLLLEKNQTVSGSDLSQNALTQDLAQRGATIYQGHASGRVQPGMQVVYTTGLKEDNPEMVDAKKLGCRTWHRSDLLAKVVENHHLLAVTGTHGKTTTSSLLASVLIEAGLDPSFCVGGVIQQYGTNARGGKGPHFVIEADESDKTFLKYHPNGAIVTNIDRDHLEHFQGSMAALEDAFQTFCKQVKEPNHFFWCGDDVALQRLKPPGNSYGLSPHCDWQVQNISQNGFNLCFDLNEYKSINLSLSGQHNALNGAAVFALALSLGIPEATIRKAFASFESVGRRCHQRGELNGVKWIDDYAHHPTEIHTTLNGIRRAIGSKKLITIFQPHRFTRTQQCLGLFGPVFEAADQVYITDLYSANEPPIAGVDCHRVIEEIAGAQYLPRPGLGKALQALAKPGDVVVTLGAGDVTYLYNEAKG